MQIYLVGALVFALIVATFAIQNTNPVQIKFLVFQLQEISLVLVILGSALIGAVVVFLLGAVKQISNFKQIRELRKENENLKSEIKHLEETVQPEIDESNDQGIEQQVSELPSESIEKTGQNHEYEKND